MAANPIAWADMAAWAQLTGRVLCPWDVIAIRSIDSVFMATASEDAAAKPSKASKARKPNGN
jgi:hypothetical protein